jgi:hypothetical protein
MISRATSPAAGALVKAAVAVVPSGVHSEASHPDAVFDCRIGVVVLFPARARTSTTVQVTDVPLRLTLTVALALVVFAVKYHAASSQRLESLQFGELEPLKSLLAMEVTVGLPVTVRVGSVFEEFDDSIAVTM